MIARLLQKNKRLRFYGPETGHIQAPRRGGLAYRPEKGEKIFCMAEIVLAFPVGM